MTIFDTIRYPISLPPSKEELEQLPKDLFERWISNSGWKVTIRSINAELIAKWYSIYWAADKPTTYVCHEDDVKDIEYLKKLIQEYNT